MRKQTTNTALAIVMALVVCLALLVVAAKISVVGTQTYSVPLKEDKVGNSMTDYYPRYGTQGNTWSETRDYFNNYGSVLFAGRYSESCYQGDQ